MKCFARGKEEDCLKTIPFNKIFIWRYTFIPFNKSFIWRLPVFTSILCYSVCSSLNMWLPGDVNASTQNINSLQVNYQKLKFKSTCLNNNLLFSTFRVVYNGMLLLVAASKDIKEEEVTLQGDSISKLLSDHYDCLFFQLDIWNKVYVQLKKTSLREFAKFGQI